MNVVSFLERIVIVGVTTFLFGIVPFAISGGFPVTRVLDVVFVGAIFCPIGAFVGHRIWKWWSAPDAGR